MTLFPVFFIQAGSRGDLQKQKFSGCPDVNDSTESGHRYLKQAGEGVLPVYGLNEDRFHKKRTVGSLFFFYVCNTVSEAVGDADLDTGHGGIGCIVFTIVHDRHVIAVVAGQPFVVEIGPGEVGIKRCPF